MKERDPIRIAAKHIKLRVKRKKKFKTDWLEITFNIHTKSKR